MSTIQGLPAHVFLVHAVVILVPLSALMLLLIAFWPAARQRFSLLATVLSAVTLVFVPITTEAGSWLSHHLPRTPENTPLIRAHAQLGDSMLPWAIGLFVVTAVIAGREFVRSRKAATDTRIPVGAGVGALSVNSQGPAESAPEPAPTRSSATHGVGGPAATIVLAVLALVVAAGSSVCIYRIGDSGATAAWTGKFSPTEVRR